jgi:DNA-binding transcriptional ArsR family regulator
MNGGMDVNIWQDESMEEQSEVVYINDVDSLRAVAEPTRLAILSALLRPPWPRIMSVKELAAELNMTPTRLYRHVRQLEEVGMIKVAETRMVSGILEQRYRATARDVRLGTDFLQSHPDESLAAVHVIIDQFIRGAIAATDTAVYRPVVFTSDPIVAPEVAKELDQRLRALHDWLNEQAEDPDGIQANVLIGFYAGPVPRRSSDNSTLS